MDTPARDQLVTRFLHLPGAIARQLRRELTLPSSLLDDLEAVGNLALVEAAERADPRRCTEEFHRFAEIRIAGAIRNYARSERRQALQQQEMMTDPPDNVIPIDTAVVRRVTAEQVERQLAALPAEQRQVIEFRAAERTYRSIASELGTNHMRVQRLRREAAADIRRVCGAA